MTFPALRYIPASVRDGLHTRLIGCEQAMLYAAGVPDQKAMKNSPHVGIASVWWEGNPCKYARRPLLDYLKKWLTRLDSVCTVSNAVRDLGRTSLLA